MSYSASKAQSGFLTQLSIASTPVFEITDITVSGKANDIVEVTNLNSLAKEYINVIADPGELQISANRVSNDPGQIAVLGAFTSKATSTFTILLPKAAGQSTAGDSYGFSGLITEFLDIGSLSPKKQIELKFKIKVTGAWSFTPGT